jgi:hypothetical protein
VLRVVEALLPWKPWKFHHAYLVKKAGLFLLDRGPIERNQGREIPFTLEAISVSNLCLTLIEG